MAHTFILSQYFHKINTRFRWVVTLALVMLAVSATASTLPRPPLEGYRFSTVIYPDAQTLAKKVCEDPGGTLDHIQYGTDASDTNHYHASMMPWCRYNGPNGNVDYTNWYSWNFAFPKGTYQGSEMPISCPAVGKPPDCDSCDRNRPRLSSQVGNPINIATREKIQRDTDYRSPTLEFTRLYTNTILSTDMASSALSVWRHNYAKSISSTTTSSTYMSLRYEYIAPRGWPNSAVASTSVAFVTRPDGSQLYFETTTMTNFWSSDSDINYSLTTQRDSSGSIISWILITPSGDTEAYDRNGLLVSIKLKGGAMQTMQYSDASTPTMIAPRSNLLISVLDSFGRTLQFQYDSVGRISKMIDPAARIFIYAYDSLGNLKDVTYPDGLKRFYHYNEPDHQPSTGYPSFVHYLTGISNELAPGNVVRYATFKYDSDGYAISTEHAEGANKYTYDAAAHVITDPLGNRHTMLFQKLNGVMLQTSVSQPSGAGSAVATSQSSYDDNGNMLSTTDFLGNATAYTYDMSRNLELTKTEGSGTSTKKASTRWHATLRSAESITQPKLRTDFTYDGNGSVLSKTVWATSDPTGSLGFSAKVVGKARVWTYAYNEKGRITELTAPGTIGSATTTFAYDTQGNLISLTNAVGHQILLSNYDVDGKPRRITSPNGVTTELSYGPRNWLESSTTGGKTTLYKYDGVGQLIQVTMPDGQYLDYTYDAAQRLTDISDNRGNHLHFTLDNAGNRISDQVTDPSGNLISKIARTYDILSNLSQQTGGTHSF